MPLFVPLRGPHVTLQRRKRRFLMIVCPRLRRWGLLPSLTLMFLSVAIASVGFFVITEVTITQKIHVDSRLAKKSRQMPMNQFPRPPVYVHRGKETTENETTTAETQTEHASTILKTAKGEFFKIHPLLNTSAPTVELSAQITLNRLYSIQNRNDVLNYYNSFRCKAEQDDTTCKNFTIVAKSENRTRWSSMKFCRLYPTRLRGRVKVSNRKFIPIEHLNRKTLKALRPGGWWEPENCISRHSVAIVIPYKDRHEHLMTLLNYLHPLLQKQEIRYKMFVVEQYGNQTFNKGVIMNAAFLEALKEELFHCFIFHDVDLIPENDYNMYSCPEMPRHLSVAVNEFNYKLPYPVLVGGAFAIRTDHFFRVNGYSNFYWGWGGEDDDMGIRVLQSGLKITRPLNTIGMYTMIKHVKRKPSTRQIRLRLLATANRRYRLEGLNSVQYTLIRKTEYPWFTNILVDVGKPHPSFTSYEKFSNWTKRGPFTTKNHTKILLRNPKPSAYKKEGKVELKEMRTGSRGDG